MNFEDFLGPKASVVDLRGQDRWQAIEELIDHLVAAGKVPLEHRDAILENVRTRESRMSTGIGFGIGIPHASTEFVPEVVGVVGRSPKGIRYDALDGKPVHLVFLFLVPAGQFQRHANTLADLAKQLHRQDFRDGLWGRFM